MTPDPLSEKYYGISPYAFCNNSPMVFVDRDGRSTHVVDIGNGLYKVVGGNLYDNDLNIYVVSSENSKESQVLGSIGLSASITSFFNYDLDEFGNVKGWMKGSIIDINDNSGYDFIKLIQRDNPSLLEYIFNARSGHKYDFKLTGGSDIASKGINPYRGISVSKDEHGTVIYISARDLGNTIAGYMAGKNGLSWKTARFGFDAYQSYQEFKKTGKLKWVKERESTQKAQEQGWEYGYKR